MCIPYAEAQFHGGVSIHDIAEVVFHVERVTSGIQQIQTYLSEVGIDNRCLPIEDE